MIFPWMIQPFLPINCEKPPTLYALLNSICNYDAEEKTNIYNLAKVGRSKIFDFEYPLTQNISKEDFEVMILNHFIMRRIGFQTPTAFKIALSVKLNEIMPMYNKLFDATLDWNLFNDGETITRVTTDNGTNTLNSSTNSSNTNISDRRNSNMPQNEIDDVANGSYMTDYSLDTNNDTGSITNNSTNNINNTTNETITKSPADKMQLYKDFIENKNNIYSMIFKDLDSLFYQLV